MKNVNFPTRLMLILVGVMAVLLVFHVAAQHLNLAHNEKHGQIFEISNRLDVDDEASIPTWFSQALWLGTACASALAMLLTANRKNRRLWFIMALIAILFSIDEVAGIHELSLQTLHLLFFGLEQSSSSLNAWWLVMPLVLLFGVWFLRRTYTLLSPKQWLIMMTGWLLFLAGATGLELYGNDIPHNTLYYQGFVTGFEEGLEMLGGIMVLYALTSYLHVHHAPQLKRTWQYISGEKK